MVWLYGFSPFTAATGNGHLFLLFQAVPPLVILLVDRFLRQGSASPWWTGLVVGLCFVAEFYISTEVFASLVVMTGIAVVVAGGYALLRRVDFDRTRLARMGACAAVVVVLGAGYGVWMAVAGPQHITGTAQPAAVIAGESTDPFGLVVPTLDQRFTLGHAALGDSYVAIRDPDWQIVIESPIENGSYVGVPLLVALVAAAIVLRRKRLALFCTAMGAAALVLSLGPHLHVDGHRTDIPLPFIVLTHLPLLDSSEAVRWETYFWLFAALLLSLALDAVRRGLAARRRLGRWGGAGGHRPAGPRRRPPARAGVALRGRRRQRAHLVHPGRAVPPRRVDRRRLPPRHRCGRLGHALAGHGRHAVPHARRVRGDPRAHGGQHLRRPDLTIAGRPGRLPGGYHPGAEPRHPGRAGPASPLAGRRQWPSSRRRPVLRAPRRSSRAPSARRGWSGGVLVWPIRPASS